MDVRYYKFKVPIPADVTKKKDREVWRKLEYLGISEDGKTIKKLNLRRSIKKPWERYIDSWEFVNNRDDDCKDMYVDINDVTILEDLDKMEFMKKYFAKLFI